MDILLLTITIIVAIPVFIFTIEILLALLPLRKIIPAEIDTRPSITVLIPAHNESGIIENTLVNISQQLTKNDRLLVVADNCTDDTVNIVRNFGSEVIERSAPNNRGKGYALDYGVRHLEKAPPQVVIIIDADCQINDGVLEKLAKLTIMKNRPVQALYLMSYNNPNIKQRIAEFAWLVKNYVRPRGLYNIGMPCQLMGTGMAFPWPVIANANLATGNIVEDVKMGLDMTNSGHAPLFFPFASVTSKFPEVITAEQSQRKRWEHGHLGMIISEVPKGIIRSIKNRNLNLLVLILDLAVPPLALLLFILLVIFFAAIFYAVFDQFSLIIYFNISLFILFFTSTFIAWIAWGRKVISFLQLLTVPLYVAKKIPLYISFLFKKEKNWIRTDRD